MARARRASVARLLAPFLAATVSGCAVAIGPQAITPPGVSVARSHDATVSIEVSGGRAGDATGLPQVSNEAFAEAVTTAIQSGRVFRGVVPATEAGYRLRVSIASLQQPLFGGAFTVTMEVGWQLERAAPRQVVAQKGITSSHTITVGEAFVGATRVKLATEGAARENVRQGVEWLSRLEL